jgi:hypothetical protein
MDTLESLHFLYLKARKQMSIEDADDYVCLTILNSLKEYKDLSPKEFVQDLDKNIQISIETLPSNKKKP